MFSLLLLFVRISFVFNDWPHETNKTIELDKNLPFINNDRSRDLSS